MSLGDSCAALALPANRLYQERFLRKLSKKVRAKARAMPGRIDDSHLAHIRTLVEFDECYTAPLHGFASAQDYYTRCSAGAGLRHIRVPSLLVNARNDPILAGGCYPCDQARDSRFFFLETPAYGGHVGFHARGGTYWSEQRAVAFLDRAPAGGP